MSLNHRLLAVSAVLVAGFLPDLATAGIIRSAVAVVNSPSGFGGTAPNSVIDQSGLSTGYVDGVTDFDAYIAQSPTHEHGGNNPDFFLGTGTPDLPIDFDLGAAYRIRQLALWNCPFNNLGAILDFEVYTANSVDFLDSTLVGSFTALNDGDDPFAAAPFRTGAQVFDLLDTNARYLRIRVLTSVLVGGFYDNVNRPTRYGLSEVAFDTSAVPSEVPEPGSLSLMVLGVAALIGVRRRRSA